MTVEELESVYDAAILTCATFLALAAKRPQITVQVFERGSKTIKEVTDEYGEHPMCLVIETLQKAALQVAIAHASDQSGS